jgi:Tfp pilus assembly protein PilO
MNSSILNGAEAKGRAVHAAGAAIALMIVLVGYKFAFAAWGADIDESTQRIDQLRKLLTASERVAAEHAGLTERMETLTKAVAATHQRLPKLGPATEFTNSVDQLATALNMTVVECAAGAPQTLLTHSTVEVTCRLSGSFASTCQLLAAIDQLAQVAKVTRLEMNTAGNSEAYPVELTFQLYYQAEVNDTEKERVQP